MSDSQVSQPESLINKPAAEVGNIEKLAPEDQEKAKQIANQINLQDSQTIVTFGVGAQKDISDFADNMLTEVRGKDTGYVGEILSDMVVKIKDLDVDSISPGGGLKKIPIFGQIFDAFQRFMNRYQKISTQIETITTELDKARMQLLRDIVLLDNMYTKNVEYIKNLDIYLAAGQLKLQELNTKLLPEMKAKAEQTKDPMDAQNYQDMSQFANRFEKKLYDLKLSRMIAIQTSPQIRLIQSGNQALVEKVQSSILNTIPLWKNQIAIAITIFRQGKAVKLQKEVSDTTNELLQKNSEMLKQNTIEVAKESERGIVEIETLQKVNSDLITTIEETLQIQADGKAKRAAAEVELSKIESELKKKLIDVKSTKY